MRVKSFSTCVVAARRCNHRSLVYVQWKDRISERGERGNREMGGRGSRKIIGGGKWGGRGTGQGWGQGVEEKGKIRCYR